jgi:hypothetical protein
MDERMSMSLDVKILISDMAMTSHSLPVTISYMMRYQRHMKSLMKSADQGHRASSGGDSAGTPGEDTSTTNQ